MTTWSINCNIHELSQNNKKKIGSGSENIIITKWNTLKPRRDFHHGYSCYYLKQGFKISKFLKEDDTLLYWYCDIVDYVFDETKNSCTSVDLLADVLLYPDGGIKVLDLNELAQAYTQQLITPEQLTSSLRRTDTLLHKIYSGEFNTYTELIEKYAQ